MLEVLHGVGDVHLGSRDARFLKGCIEQPAGWADEQERLYRDQRYHQPSDEYSAAFDLSGTVQQVRVLLRVALAVANGAEMPRWNQSSEFQRPGARR